MKYKKSKFQIDELIVGSKFLNKIIDKAANKLLKAIDKEVMKELSKRKIRNRMNQVKWVP